jgi:hypothetical protein
VGTSRIIAVKTRAKSAPVVSADFEFVDWIAAAFKPGPGGACLRFGFALLVAALVGGCASPDPITEVSVRDAQFQIVKVLTPAELSEFRRQWENKQEVTATLSNVGGEHFNIDIDRRGAGDRWLYQTTGHVQLLDPWRTPVYKLQDPEAFNRLIGANK